MSTIGRYPSSEDDAAARYKTYCGVDPFPEIEAALLNSADICDYVAATGMIFPFCEHTDLLKPASYGPLLKGRGIYWDRNSKKHDLLLSDGKIEGYENYDYRTEFDLERNSIAFITLEPTFRMPLYLAFRFNLAIREVYRGLLLGTGPIVDPGFQGKISFPLHNLTDEKYTLVAGEQRILFI